ncbi:MULTISPECIES: hypothetical protein [Bacteria]|nr:hypothetical protein [Burkholderia contaminans]MBH9672112.1 hypothetical protein [Burkholderia contaminans]MBH9679556.1 hypothetical protein [Burkholderia contaminans]MBH9709519.1 hypothetical protein [Burkholderia contaminans]
MNTGGSSDNKLEQPPQPASAAQPAPAAMLKQTRILVVDDELCGLSHSHLRELVADPFEDLSSPEFSALWDIVKIVKNFGEVEEYGVDAARSYISSDAVVNEVILSAGFTAHASQPLKEKLQPFLNRANDIDNLRQNLEMAFPSPSHSIEYIEARPDQKSLIEYDLIILDLVLKSSTAAVDQLIDYLRELGALGVPLPCIILMSSHRELVDSITRFSAGSKISAAGMIILPKSEVRKKEFGHQGLSLCYQQLDRQREIAERMRVFMRTWIGALKDASDKASEALWNLDAAAMQDLHLTAFSDNDPYDEYLSELLAREYLWHVESNSAVGTAIENLDETFQKYLRPGEKVALETRFIAPFVKPKNGRGLISHFTWTGFGVPDALANLNTQDAISRFNRLVPFGAVLAPEVLTPETECLVHITQQCDLNQAGNPKRIGQSAQFAVALPVAVQDHRMPLHATDQLVARGLPIAGKEYDLCLAKGRQLALPIPKFVDYVKTEGLRVIGRLRHDIAMQFLLATANHMTRWAALKVKSVEVKNVRLYLHGANFPNGNVYLSDEDAQASATTVQVSTLDKLNYFHDDASIRVALWIARELENFYHVKDIDVARLSNILCLGVTNNSNPLKQIVVRMMEKTNAEIDGWLKGMAENRGLVTLFIVYPPDAGENEAAAA